MSLFEKKNDALDRAVSQIQAEDVDPAVIEQAAARVWERLSHAAAEPRAELQSSATEPLPAAAAPAAPHSLRACEDFQSLIPAYLRGELPPARALLVEDHTRSCVPCRRALREAREGRDGKSTAPSRPAAVATISRMRPVWLGLAALLVLGLGTGLFLLAQDMLAGGSRMARIESVDGALFRIDGEFSEPIRTGTVLAEGDEIRTAKGSTALVRMTDGSRIEMSERAGLYLEATRKGNIIHLGRGRVIVQAAKQRPRHLYVSTSDALVSVTGTIFSVNTGTKGSRVSVIEGEVHVNQAKREDVLHAGGQVTTHASVAAVPVREEIAWSRNAAQYDQLLAELTAAGQDIDARVARPGLRYSSHLLDLAPASTRAWVGLPNLGTNLAETERLLDEKIADSQALRQWWNQTIGSAENDTKFHEMIGRLGALGQHLGDEVAIAVAGAGEDCRPALLAEVTNENAFRTVLEQEVGRLDAKGHLQIVDDPASVPSGESEKAWLWIGNGLFVATTDGDLLRSVAANANGAANPFAGSAFHNRVAEEYHDGANWLFSADLASFVGDHLAGSPADAQSEMEKSGFSDLQYFVVNRREVDGTAETRAAVTFKQARRGVASWLAAPAPMGGLAYFSPDTHLAAAFVVKQPTSLIDDLLAMNPEFATEIEKLRSEHGIDLRADLAAPLGGEIAFGVDGPLVPEPSWKLVAEVYDSARLQSTIEKVVDYLNDELREQGKPGVQIETVDASGHTFYSLGSSDGQHRLSWVYDDGYVVAAQSRALLERAISQRESGVSLASTSKFRGLLGSDGQVNVSAFYYQNLAELAKTAGKVLPQGALGGDRGPGSLASFLIGDGPSLLYAYAEEDRILFASTNKSPLGLNLQTLTGFGGVLGMMDHAHERAQEEAR
ncbi:MAG TPA: FecR domain-containing protein [Thermoanaerobaculia bacterium]|nr:FecR domain-containing protein [Thermoanaerobaculia bacterium]